MPSLRERNKARRREAILDAALALLRSNALQDVTIEQIASEAQVSPPTVYNLVGTRKQLLLALVDRVVQGLMEALSAPQAEAEDDPIAAARLVVRQSAAAFVADGAAFRQIMRELRRFAGSGRGAGISFDPSQLQVTAMRRAQARGILRAELDPQALGRQIYLGWIAACLLWSSDGLSDRGFHVAAEHGLLSVLCAAATDAHRPGFLAELAELGDQLARVSWATS